MSVAGLNASSTANKFVEISGLLDAGLSEKDKRIFYKRDGFHSLSKFVDKIVKGCHIGLIDGLPGTGKSSTLWWKLRQYASSMVWVHMDRTANNNFIMSTTRTKSVNTQNLSPLSEDLAFQVPRAYFWIFVFMVLLFLPWILILILVDNAWWAFGPLFGNSYHFYRLLFMKTVKFTLHASDNSVTHYNSVGGKVFCQNAVPMSNYEKIRVTTRMNYAHVTFVKTDAYYDALVACNGCAVRCLPFEESYVVNQQDANNLMDKLSLVKETV